MLLWYSSGTLALCVVVQQRDVDPVLLWYSSGTLALCGCRAVCCGTAAGHRPCVVVVQQRDIGPVDKTGEDNARQVFARIAGSDGEVDAYELQTILNTVFMKGQH